MKFLNEMIEELIDISHEFSHGEITLDERNLKIDLLINQVEQLEINYVNPIENLPMHVKSVYESLLSRHKYKAIVSLKTLKQVDNKRTYNATVRHLISKKLYFNAMLRSINRSIWGYSEVNKMVHVKDFTVLKFNENEGEENE
ncbi:hypothetical protein [Niallia taxi]|uniref:hypothetical protein n=1 Tax=Niallia taxi TaxID=2499688 RepID=UPI002E20D4FF|nr:hypothetical protein [Niallia taxi]